MANENDVQAFDRGRVREVLETWVVGKQDAFAERFSNALKERGDELAVSTINSAFSRAKAGEESWIKIFFGTPNRLWAFAKAAEREDDVGALEASLMVATAQGPLVFAIASDHGRGNMNTLTTLVRTLSDRGCAPRIVVETTWMKALEAAQRALLETWRGDGLIIPLPETKELADAITRLYEGSSAPKCWIVGDNGRRGLPASEAIRVSFHGTEVRFDPADFPDRLKKWGVTARKPRPHPEKTPDGIVLERTSLEQLATRAGVDVKTESLSPVAVSKGDGLGARHAALVEVARGYPAQEALEWQGLAENSLPELSHFSARGYHVKWGPDARLALSLGAALNEETSLSKDALAEAVKEAQRHARRAKFERENRSAERAKAPEDAFLADCRARGLSHWLRSDYSSEPLFVEVGDDFHVVGPGTQADENLVGKSFQESLARLERSLASRSAERHEGNPLLELTRVSKVAPEAAWKALLVGATRRDGYYASGTVPCGPEVRSLAEHWDRAERAVAALGHLGTRADPEKALRESLERPIGSIVGVWPYARLAVPVQPENGGNTRVVAREGSSVVSLRVAAGDARDRSASDRDATELTVIRAILWLKAVLREGTSVVLAEDGEATRLVIADLRGLVAEVTAWTVPAGSRELCAAVIVPVHEHEHDSRHCQRACGGITTHQLRYADRVTYPSVLWLASGDKLVRADLGPPSGLLDWEPLTTSEADAMAADDRAEEARRAMEDDDD